MNANTLAVDFKPLTQTNPEPKFARDHFTYRGREWRIFKRGNGPKAKWNLYFEHNLKRHKYSLGEVEKRSAIESAKIIIDGVLDGHKDAVRKMMRGGSERAIEYSALTKLVETFERMPLDISYTHRRNAVYSFKVVMRSCGGSEFEKLTAAALSEQTARAFFEAAMVKAKRERDQEDEARIKRSANSTFAQAACLFRSKCLSKYRDAGLVLPDVQAFLAVFDEEKFTGITPVYNPPDEKLIRKTLHAWLDLPRNEFIAAGLELSCGLRKGEVAQVTWGMWSRSMGSALLDGRGQVKNQSGRFVVAPIDPFWKLLNRRIEREKWRGQPDELVLQGSKTDLEDNIFRNIGAWLRGLGWETQKTNHALRAYSGSLVAMKFDIFKASAWLRHSSVKVTQQNYTHFLNERVFNPKLVRVRFAKG